MKIPDDEDIINVDCDGVLTKSVCWTPHECLYATPNKEVIEFVNKLYLHKFIIIYTARRDNLIPATLEWLRKNDVRFHAISNNKIPGFYIDDKCINIRELV